MSGESEPKAGSFDWREYYHAVVDRIWVVAIAVVIAAVAGAVNLSRQETLYRAKAVLVFTPEKPRVLDGMNPVQSDDLGRAEKVNTMLAQLQGVPFAQKVVAKHGLNTDKTFLESAGIEMDKISEQDAARTLASMIKAQFRDGTLLLEITATNRNSKLAIMLANAYAEDFVASDRENRSQANSAAYKFLVAESERLRQAIRKSEQDLQAYRERERTPSLEKQQEDAQKKLSDVITRTTALEEQISQVASDIAVAKMNPDKPEDLLRLPSISHDAKIAALLDSIATQQREFDILAQRYRPKHPDYRAAQARLQLSIEERDRILRNSVSILETTQEQLKIQLDQAKRTKVDYENSLLQVTGKSVDYNDLVRTLDSDKTTYNVVLERLKQVDVTKSLDESPVQIHELATKALASTFSSLKILGTALLGGFVLGVGGAIGLHLMDQSVKTVDDAESTTSLPVLSAVPLIQGTATQVDLVSFRDRDGLAAEAFRSLRATINGYDLDNKQRVFLFTSAMPSEGKSFCSSNYSIVLAQQHLKTVLVDADLRKPRVSKLFFGENRQPGLDEVLSGDVRWQDAVIESEVPNLHIITAGRRVADPTRLLSSSAFEKLMMELLEKYDRVVIDSAPCIAVSDTLLILSHADAVCFVVRAFTTPKQSIKRALKLLTNGGARLSGILLNRLPTGRGGYYSYYYSGRYGGDEPYGSKDS